MERATFGAGCFWGVEAAFREVEGVTATRVGYLGGTLKNPTYRDVCSGKTGHAEVVEVTYRSREGLVRNAPDTSSGRTTIRRSSIARVPTTARNIDRRYSYHSPAQEAAARASKKSLEEARRHRKPIVTEITPASDFWEAEEYHQQYLEKRGLASCHL